jgi:HupE / UreJ protein
MRTQRLFGGWRKAVAVLSLCLLACLPAQAHKASDAYLLLSAPNAQPQAGAMLLKLSIALRDVDAALDGLDADDNRALTWGEIKQALPAIQIWVSQGIALRCDGAALNLPWQFDALEQRSDGAYVRLAASGNCAVPQALAVDYRLLQGLDATHRLLVGGTLGQQPVASVIAPHVATLAQLRGAGANAGEGAIAAMAQTPGDVFSKFLVEGLHHIATGYDHLAFLLALLLPIVLLRSAQATTLAQVGRPGVWALVRTVTGFTIGHSITLAVASLGWLTAPPWIEPAIAITIGIAAWLNLYPQRWLRGDLLALLFGLIHGVAFSEVIREAGIGGASLLWALAGFNVGVELGQLLGVALWCVVHVQLVRWHGYERWVVRAGSWALLLLAAIWFIKRLLV